MKTYDLIVIGAGPGGYVAAIRAAQNGLAVAVCEADAVGGTCLNRGCIPTKALLHSARAYQELQNASFIGILADNVRFDLAKIHARKDAVVSQLQNGIEQLLKANKIDLIRARAAILGQGRVRAGDETLGCKSILIASGSKPALPHIPGIEFALTSDSLLAEARLYPRLVIIGGGVIGMEFASLYSAFGCEVAVIEAMDRILPTMDREISQNLGMILKKRGVRIFAGARVEAIEKEKDGFACRFTAKGNAQEISADAVLCAVGRRANTENLFAKGFSVACEHGHIQVDDAFRTNVAGVYAIGDVIGKIQLAHAASAQGICIADALAEKPRSVNLDVIPACIYTDPEIASVGLTVDEAKMRGMDVKTGKFLLTATGKALIEECERSFIKTVFDAQSEKLIGVQMMCPRATDLIGEAATAVANGLTTGQLISVVRPHPTFCESFTEAVEAADGRAIHAAPPRR